MTGRRDAGSRSMSPPSAPPARKRRRPPLPLPPVIEARVRAFALELAEAHRGAFRRNPRLKRRVASLLVRCLPPLPRRAGRPGLTDVSEALRAHASLRRAHPQWSPKRLWREVYRRCVAGWEVMGDVERREESFLLHQRCRWRLDARKRSARTPHAFYRKILA